jgi:hypothetical protein
MVGSQAAWDRAKAAIEETYDGICTVYTYSAAKDPVTHISKMGEVALHTDIACRISFKNNVSNNSQPSDTASAAVQTIKLFTYPDKAIPKGSKIVVTQNGVTVAYKSSGEPLMYYTHQEIILELFDKWA